MPRISKNTPSLIHRLRSILLRTRGFVADPLRREKGSTLPLAIVASLVLVAMLALAFDFGAQLVVAERNNSDLQICREELNQTAAGFVIKNSSNPGKEIAQEALDSLREQGFSGQVAVYVSEAKKGYSNNGSTLASTRRLLSIEIIMLDQSTAMFSRISGIDTLPVTTDITFSISPYSAYSAWRPTDSATQTCFIADKGETTVKSGRVEDLSMNVGYTTTQIWENVSKEMNSTLPQATK